MTTMTADSTGIIGGIDTHQDLHTAAVVSHDGTVLGAASFSTTRAGYRAMLRWFRSHAEARMAVFEFTEGWYNPRRRHSVIGYLSPVNYERSQLPPARPSP